MQKGDDPYEILGVEEEATTSEIRKAYRKLAVIHHPDKQPTEEGREKAHHVFARIACAYELLSDDESRKAYHEQQDEVDEGEESPGFDGNATYDYPFDPDRNAGSTAIVPATSKTGKGGFFKKKPKKKKPFHFHDPYEVFKRAFKEEFGYEYPGAKWDNIEKTGKDVHNRAKNAPLALENGGKGDAAPPEDEGDGKKKKKGGILALFKGKNKDKQLAEHKGGKGGGGDGKDAYKQAPGNNRPTSMETKITQVEHDDGTIETITETSITRPDGSVETMRQTDMPEKGTHDWTKPKEPEEVKKLTSGKEGQRMLTNGEKGKAGSNKKDAKKLTNGGKGDGKKKGGKKAITNG